MVTLKSLLLEPVSQESTTVRVTVGVPGLRRLETLDVQVGGSRDLVPLYCPLAYRSLHTQTVPTVLFHDI